MKWYRIVEINNPHVKKTMTAIIDLKLNLERPQRPCPLVQPLPNLVPKPTKRPAKPYPM